MLKKFLKDIVAKIAGKSAAGIIDILDGKKYTNEFVIAKKLDLTINQTRNLLYKITDYGLVSSIRKKDKRKGWYTYFWKLEIMKSLEFLRGELIKMMDQISHQIKSRETKEFYVCDVCNIEFNEENALVHNFMCNECGGIVSRKDNTSIIKEFNRNLDRLRKELELVDEELNLEKEKVEKIKVRETKKQEKIKQEAKQKIKDARAKAKKKEAPKTKKTDKAKKNKSSKKIVKKKRK
jgi:transcription factor E